MSFFGVKHEEATAAGTHDFSAEGAAVQSNIVKAINPRVSNLRGQILLHRPVLVEQSPEAWEVVAFDGGEDVAADFLDAVKSFDR